MKSSVSKIKTICFGGLIVRIIALIMTLMFSENLTTGYLRSNYDSDDLRYQDGAIIYRDIASSIIDVPAFANAFAATGDNQGYSNNIALWYWLMCIMMYIFKYPLIVKLINVGFGVLCIFLIYKLCKLVYPNNLRIAVIATNLYAYFPYPVFFCCFLYKDQFLTLILLSILYLVYKYNTILKPLRLVKLGLLLTAFTMVRSGLLPVLVIIIGYIEVTKNKDRHNSISSFKTLLIVSLTVIISYILYTLYYDIIALKYEAYVSSRDTTNPDGNTIGFFTMNGLSDIWKTPLAYAFTIVQPLYIGGEIKNWSSLVGIFNFCSIPIVIVNVYYFFQEKGNKVFWFSMMIIFVIMLVVSMGVTRHFYYLLPYVFIFYADAITSCKGNLRLINKIGIGLAAAYAVFIIVPSICFI